MRFQAGILAAIVLLAAPHVQAADCFYVGLSSEARVIRDAGELIRPYPETRVDSRCETLEVAKGTVYVYTTNKSSKKIIRKQLSEGLLVDAEEATSEVGQGRLAQLTREFKVIFSGLQLARQGSSRSDGGDYIKQALPSGKISMPLEDIVIGLSPNRDPLFQSLELESGGKRVFFVAGPRTELRFPAALFANFSTLNWHLLYEGNRLDGTMTVVKAAELQDLRRALEIQYASLEDTRLKALSIATDLQASGFVWDSHRELMPLLQKGMRSPED